MRVVLQRVRNASVLINGSERNSIDNGLLILLGICNEDGQEDIDWLVRKICNLRIYDDENGIMNKSIMDVQGSFLVISQFTLYASTKKGNRPSYIRSAKPEISEPLYEKFVDCIKKESGLYTTTGKFGADMQVTLHNDGPVTIVIDTHNKE